MRYILCGISIALLAATGGAIAQEVQPVETEDGVHLLIRRNFSDIWLFDDPTAPAMAQGAAFSYVHDGVLDDDTWSVQGMVALPFTFGGDNYGPVIGASIAPYFQMDRQNHTGDGVDVNVMSGGFSGEVGFDAAGGANFFRTRLGVTRDEVADTTAVNVVGEWLPVYDRICVGYPCSFPGVPIIFRFNPELVVAYSGAFDSSGPLPFSGGNESLLIGPELSLVFKAFGSPIPLLNNLSGKVSYVWSQEVYSGQDFDYFSASATYNLDPTGHIGITLGYENGTNGLTGEDVDQVMLSLTGKL